MKIVSNRSLAEFNLRMEPELQKLKAQVQERSEEGEALCSRIQELLEEYSKFIVALLRQVIIFLICLISFYHKILNPNCIQWIFNPIEFRVCEL